MRQFHDDDSPLVLLGRSYTLDLLFVKYNLLFYLIFSRDTTWKAIDIILLRKTAQGHPDGYPCAAHWGPSAKTAYAPATLPGSVPQAVSLADG